MNIDLLNLKKEDCIGITPISMKYKDIDFDIYGVLHGISGGTNQEYISEVNKAIAQSTGLKLSESSMKFVYKGIEKELDDWIQVPFIDLIKFLPALLHTPFNTLKIFKLLIKEKFTKNDPFFLNKNKIEYIGGSLAFHMIDPVIRRELAGFLPAEDYFLENIYRHIGKKTWKIDKLIDKNWTWLLNIEPYLNIPFRSIHMIESAVLLAHKYNHKKVSLFVGEIHNTDILWYVNLNKNNLQIEKVIEKIISKVNKHYSSPKQKIFNFIKYITGMAIGGSIPICIILFLVFALKMSYQYFISF